MLQLTHCEIDKDFSLKASYVVGDITNPSPQRLSIIAYSDSTQASLLVEVDGETTEDVLENMAEKLEHLASLIRQRGSPTAIISTYSGM